MGSDIPTIDQRAEMFVQARLYSFFFLPSICNCTYFPSVCFHHRQKFLQVCRESAHTTAEIFQAFLNALVKVESTRRNSSALNITETESTTTAEHIRHDGVDVDDPFWDATTAPLSSPSVRSSIEENEELETCGREM